MAKKIEIENTLADIIKDSLNKKNKHAETDIAYILGKDFQSSSDVKFWIPSGNMLLDLAMSNRKNGGYPSGRIVEITGLEASGKSLLAAYAIANVQKLGGIGVLIDTENAISREFLEAIGVDLNSMLYSQLETIEEIFQSIEDMLEILDKNQDKDKKPVVIVVDSLSAATTKTEQASEYDKDGYATSKAILLSKAMRKITNLIGKKNVLLLFTNQLRDKVGASFGDLYCVDPHTTKITIRYKNHSNEYIIEKMFLSEFSDRFCNNDDFDTPEEFDIEDFGLEIMSLDGFLKEIWNPIKTFIIKDPVQYHYSNGKLKCSEDHKILYNDAFISVKNISSFTKINEPLQIVDFELGGNNTYFANDLINHNTTSGGHAVGFHSSIRLRLKQIGQLKAKINNVEQVVGVKSRAQVVKNRIGPPFKVVQFDIYFDSGIDEIGSILQVSKDYGIIEQAGAWSTFTNEDTGEIIKFQGKDFETKILSNPSNKEYLYNKISEMFIVKYKPSTDNDIEVDNTVIED